MSGPIKTEASEAHVVAGSEAWVEWVVVEALAVAPLAIARAAGVVGPPPVTLRKQDTGCRSQPEPCLLELYWGET